MNEVVRGERLQVMLTGDELRAVDDWRFSRRMPSRAAAIRELLKRGLAAEGFATADAQARSQSFGVIDAAPTSLDDRGGARQDGGSSSEGA
jgi:hypothetical protein